MTDFSTFGTISVLVIILIYLVYTLLTDVITIEITSLRNSERLHRMALVIGGMLIGLGLGSQQAKPAELELLGDEFILGILFAIAGVFLIALATYYLKSQLWDPLENISQYSANFGSKFIATRLPEAGGIELQRFAARFNENAIKLANDISNLEINIERIEESIDKTRSSGRKLTDSTSNLSEVTNQYNQITNDQSDVIQNISDQVGDFATWYLDTQEQLRSNFIELRSISEMGNLIAINAAVEASNLETPHPGFETLATRLRDLARSLEERQESLRRLLDQISLNYEDFRQSIQANIQTAVNISGDTTSIGKQVEQIVSNVNQSGTIFTEAANSLETSIDQLKSNIPTAYVK